jgi:TldD protein
MSPDPVLSAMSQELNRSFQNLKKTPAPPYFLSYQLTDNDAIRISSSFGALTGNDEYRTRVLDIVMRLGDYALDNTHPFRENYRFADLENYSQFFRIPLENDLDALRMAMWYETDLKYKKALERFERVKANVAVKVAQEDRSGDFSRAPTEKYFEPEAKLRFDRALWEQKIRKYTEPFSKYGSIMYASAYITAETETRRHVNTDGTAIQMSTTLYNLIIYASAKADDGMELPLQKTYMSFKPENLPDDETILRDVENMIKTLLALRNAPLAEPYTGPAILSGSASAVFFHEIFGHRIEGQRQKNEDEAQTFKKKINQAVLPDFLSVYSDPTLKEINGKELTGYYKYDDEGVKARRVNVVEGGILKNFLMSRTPIEGFTESNGHGRNQQGYGVVARQSNLIIESRKAVSRAELKKMLIEQVKASNKPYGLFFDEIEGGYTFTKRSIPNAFTVLPTIVYRVYPDGREELVRGVDIIGTPLIAFSKIVATDDEVGIFNGMCGAESGLVPVSSVSPGLLVSQIEVQRKEKSQEKIPLLPPPSMADREKK